MTGEFLRLTRWLLFDLDRDPIAMMTKIWDRLYLGNSGDAERVAVSNHCVSQPSHPAASQFSRENGFVRWGGHRCRRPPVLVLTRAIGPSHAERSLSPSAGCENPAS